MKKYEIKKHFCLTAIWLFTFIFLWLIFSYWFIVSAKTATGHNFSDISILKSVYMDNYQGLRMVVGVCSLPFLFSLNYLLLDEHSPFLLRFPSRNALVIKNAINSLGFSFIFALIHEVVCALGCIIVFGHQNVLHTQIIYFSVLNTLSVFLYFFRMALILLFVRNFITAKRAHYGVFVLYFVEIIFLAENLPDTIWLPCKDALVIGELIEKTINSIDVALILTREIVLCVIVLMLTLLGAEKKDVLTNEKN